MTLSLGYLTAKQKMIWDLKSRGQQEASIARKLGVTRQTIHSVLDTANLKIGEALKEMAEINKIEVRNPRPKQRIPQRIQQPLQNPSLHHLLSQKRHPTLVQTRRRLRKMQKTPNLQRHPARGSKRPQLPNPGRYEQDFAIQTGRSTIRKNNR